MEHLLEGFKDAATADHGMHACPASKDRIRDMCKTALIRLSSKLSSAEEMTLCGKLLTSLTSSDDVSMLKAIGTILYFTDV